jgi:formiminotetrahydrofolate cyclodeaminase
MDGRNRDIIKAILKRAMEEGREGRVKMIQDRLKSAREIPYDHKQILFELQIFGRVLPKSPWASSTVH